MEIKNAILQRRSIRKFQQKPIPREILFDLVDMARMHASGNNLQPVRYAIISDPDTNRKIFPLTRWAGYLPNFKIQPGEEPAAYIVLLRDSRVKKSCDYDIGAASTNIMLTAVEYGLGTCCIGSFSREPLTSLLGLDRKLVPELVIALGYPAHESRAVPCIDGNIRYSQNENGVFEVPKRDLEDVIVLSK